MRRLYAFEKPQFGLNVAIALEAIDDVLQCPLNLCLYRRCPILTMMPAILRIDTRYSMYYAAPALSIPLSILDNKPQSFCFNLCVPGLTAVILTLIQSWIF